MDHVYLKGTTKYTVSLCTIEDIEPIYAIVASLVTDVSKEEYVKKMHKSVTVDMAYKVTCNNKIVSVFFTDKVINTWLGYVIWSQNIVPLILVLKTFVEDFGDRRIKFYPHVGMLQSIKSIVTRKSIRLIHNGNPYLIVNTKEVGIKMEKLYYKLGISKCQL